jgi:predicted ATPase
MSNISKKMIEDALAEIKRELRYRQEVYPHLLQSKKISMDIAAKRNTGLEYAKMILTSLKRGEDVQEKLF